MTSAPKLLQDEFSIRCGSSTFRLVWTDPMSTEDKDDLLAWLDLVKRRIDRLPVVSTAGAEVGISIPPTLNASKEGSHG